MAGMKRHFSKALLVQGTVPAPNQMTIPPDGSLNSCDVAAHPPPAAEGILVQHGVGMVAPLAMVNPPIPPQVDPPEVPRIREAAAPGFLLL